MRVVIVEDEPFMTEAVRNGLRLEAITDDVAARNRATVLEVSALRKRRRQPWIIATVARGVGCRIDTRPEVGHEGTDRG